MEPRRLAASLRGVPEPLAERVLDYLGGLTGDQVSAARGLGTRLALLSESCAGPYLVPGGPADRLIDLRAGLEGGDVVLFSLNASVYGKLAAQLGALAIQDLVSASGYRLLRRARTARRRSPSTSSRPSATTTCSPCWPGRASRGSACSPPPRRWPTSSGPLRGSATRCSGIVGVKIAHRQDVPESAEMIAKMAGTQWVWEETRHVRGMLSPGNRAAGQPAPGGAVPGPSQRDQDAARRARGGADQVAELAGAAGAGDARAGAGGAGAPGDGALPGRARAGALRVALRAWTAEVVVRAACSRARRTSTACWEAVGADRRGHKLCVSRGSWEILLITQAKSPTTPSGSPLRTLEPLRLPLDSRS